MSIESINPATGEALESYTRHSLDDALEGLGRCAEAQRVWATRTFESRAARLRAAADALERRRDALARRMTLEMGKPLTQAEAEVDKCAWVCRYYAQHGASFLADEPADTDASRAYVTFRPLGVILAIMPWNFPLWQVFRFAAPALMAGNGVVLKHADNVPGCSEDIESIWRDADLPDGLFQAFRLDHDAVAALMEDSAVAAVTLTGSTRAGAAVAATAGKNLKKCVLELGGSDPYVILSDADVDRAAETCVTSRLINNGQSCIAAKRFIVVERVLEPFTEAVVSRMSARVLGDPLDPDTDLGPMAREDLRDALHEQVEKSVAAGARCVLGGTVPDRPGAYYPATVLTDVGPEAPAWSEELFGPVASIIPAADEEEAIRIANQTEFGLGAAIFTRDMERGEAIARTRLEAGACFVNEYVRSDPRLPFGGIKRSGYGRELSQHGIREFVNVKTVWVS